MTWLFAGIVVLHGLIHLMGFVKAFELAEISQLEEAIPRGLGLLWLAAAALFGVTAVLLLLEQRQWVWVGAGAVVLSQALVVTAWSDAKYGTVANVLILAGVVYALAARWPRA